MVTESELIELLEKEGIPFQYYPHPAVFTVEEAEALAGHVPGAGSKNLFLCDESGARCLLLMTAGRKRVDLKAFAALAGAGRGKLRFASEELLEGLLGVSRGAVTVMGLINDREQRVELWVDRDLWQAELLHAHPLVNTATLAISPRALEQFFNLTGHPLHLVDVPAKA